MWFIKIVKLGDISSITTGQVIKRKEARPGDVDAIQYRILTLKSFDEDGFLVKEEIDSFKASEEIESKYITSKGDIVVRLSMPFTSITIDEESEGILIPSLFVAIRVNCNDILPSYLSLYLNSNKMKKQYIKEARGSAIQILKTSAFKEFEIMIPDMSIQEQAVTLNELLMREKRLLQLLIKENNKRNQIIFDNMITGGLNHGD
ncbi:MULTISPECIES: restriction endonuclease subunit S [Eubacteriales]|uniref:Restriction endonuclease subunit S n=1 Tax=Clostridium faecium TaxID=2762223 RepID=A0ABR8YWQ2_9CLOT|nr:MULTISPECIES: restriction endonuclease subunit S [Eubacteriales]MBD8048676.1 restriction endonuclease subunit S [Clostridium faecium]WIV13621.1 restriction endonuclease subunit S [Proteiniborus sp. MB09-C3]